MGVFIVFQVVCGQNCSFLVQSNGTVLAVGEGQYGRLGQGNSDDLYIPTIISAFQGTIFIHPPKHPKSELLCFWMLWRILILAIFIHNRWLQYCNLMGYRFTDSLICGRVCGDSTGDILWIWWTFHGPDWDWGGVQLGRRRFWKTGPRQQWKAEETQTDRGFTRRGRCSGGDKLVLRCRR